MRLYTYFGKDYEDVPRDVTHVLVAECVAVIKRSAFDNCRLLVRVIMYDCVITIEESAFSHCESLVSIRLSQRLRYIGGWAFEGCYSLDAIFIPCTVERIDDWAFSHCRSLRIFLLPASVKFVGKGIVDPYEDLLTKDKYKREGRMISNNDEVHESLKLRYDEFPLLKVCYSTSITVEMFQKCIEQHGIDCARDIDEHRMTALHILAANAHAMPDVIQACITAYPGATNVRDITGRYPIHYARAINTGSFVGFVQTFLEKNDVDWFKDIYNNEYGEVTPLGLPLALRITKEIDREDIPLLHFLAKYPNPCLSRQVVRACFDANTKDATTKDRHGKLPIHYAAMNQEAGVEYFISLLAEAQDRSGNYAASMTDENNDTATALAIRHNSNKAVKLYLYSVQPLLKSECATFEASEELEGIILKYIDAMVEIIPSLGFSHHTMEIALIKQMGFAQHIITLKDEHFIERWVQFISDAERCPIQSVRAIANFKDSLGRKMLEYAVPAIRDAILQRVLFLGRYQIVKGPPIHKSDTTVVLKAFDSKGDDYYHKIFDEHTNDGRKALDRAHFLDLVKKIYGEVDESFAKQVFFKYGQPVAMKASDFITFCKETFDNGQQRVIALKLMKNQTQFDKEKGFRDGTHHSCIVPIEQAYNADTNVLFRKAIDAHKDEVSDINLSLYKYAIIMPFGDRNLDMIYMCEQPNEAKTRGYCKEIAEAMKTLVENRICHGDLTLKNILRLNNGRLKLIDLDASTRLLPPGHYETREAKNYAGAKFSSGILPPEMICHFDQKDVWKKEKFENYFEDEMIQSSKLWCKIKPEISGQQGFVIKTFSAVEEVEKDLNNESYIATNIKCKDDLPYDTVPASEAIDLWAFGVLLYTLLTGKSLFEVNHCSNDLANFRAFQDLSGWDDQKKEERLSKDVADPNARDLLMILLSRNPSSRGSFGVTCTHPFFDVNRVSGTEMNLYLDRFEGSLQESLIDSVTSSVRSSLHESTSSIFSKLKDIECVQELILSKTENIQKELGTSSRKMMNAIFDASEVDTPTCFVILPKELVIDSGDKMAQADRLVKKTVKLMDWVEDTKDTRGRLDKASEKYIQLIKGRKHYLYLVDEYTGMPVQAGPYPIEVRVPYEKLKKYIPVMMVGWAGLCLMNTGLSFAKMFYPGIPTIPKSKLENAKGFIDSIKNAEFTVAGGASESGKPNPLRGPEYREFSRYLMEKDAKCSFAGLRRVCDPCGNAIWVTAESAKLLKMSESKEGEDIVQQLKDTQIDRDMKAAILDERNLELKVAMDKMEEMKLFIKALSDVQAVQEKTAQKRCRFWASFLFRQRFSGQT